VENKKWFARLSLIGAIIGIIAATVTIFGWSIRDVAEAYSEPTPTVAQTTLVAPSDAGRGNVNVIVAGNGNVIMSNINTGTINGDITISDNINQNNTGDNNTQTINGCD